METKICTKCSIEKPLTEYYKHPNTKDKLKAKCKKCYISYYKNNPKKKLWDKQNYINNQDTIKAYSKTYHQANRERQLARMKQRSIEKKEEIKIQHQQYYLENKERIKSKVKEYQQNNRKKLNQYCKTYHPQYNQKHPERRLWRNLLYRVLGVNGNPKTNSTYKMLGYTHKQLKEHLDKLNMNWDKHTVDHKIPITWFKPNTPVRIVNALVNLHPLTEFQNKSKNNKFCSPVPNSYINVVQEWVKEEYLSMLKSI